MNLYHIEIDIELATYLLTIVLGSYQNTLFIVIMNTSRTQMTLRGWEIEAEGARQTSCNEYAVPSRSVISPENSSEESRGAHHIPHLTQCYSPVVSAASVQALPRVLSRETEVIRLEVNTLNSGIVFRHLDCVYTEVCYSTSRSVHA